MSNQGTTGVLGRAFHAVGGALAKAKEWLFDGHPMTFGDALDLVNPLQHLPLVSTLYRKFTGDVISPAMELAGGALFGGPLGAGLAALGLGLKAGKDAADKPPATSPVVAALSRPDLRVAMQRHGPPAAVFGARPRPPGGDAVASAYTRPGLPARAASVDEHA